MRSEAFGCDIRAGSGRQAVLQACSAILEDGVETAPRGKRTKEILFARITIDSPTDTVADGIGRKGLLPAIGYGEALQCISGVSAPGLMADISSGFPKPSSRWADDVPTYGERLGESDQLGTIVDKLQGDPDCRQAVALIWHADDMTAGQASNLCTIGLQFLLRDSPSDPNRAPRELHMAVHMRSNDAWHGLPYDLFQFAQVQCSLANALGADVGKYVHTANSLHLYEQHWERAGELQYAADFEPAVRPWGVGRVGDTWPEIRERAAKLLRGELPSGYVTTSELLYDNVLSKYTKEA
jgi:thymidylate synthase